MVSFFAVFQGQQRDLGGTSPAVQTGFFRHGFLLDQIVA
jgi:hypothetical protein